MAVAEDEVTICTTTVKRKVGECPACRAYLWGEVEIRTTVRDPFWSDREPRPTATASAKAVAMSVTHECRKTEED
jgi:hypothetical protein